MIFTLHSYIDEVQMVLTKVPDNYYTKHETEELSWKDLEKLDIAFEIQWDNPLDKPKCSGNWIHAKGLWYFIKPPKPRFSNERKPTKIDSFSADNHFVYFDDNVLIYKSPYEGRNFWGKVEHRGTLEDQENRYINYGRSSLLDEIWKDDSRIESKRKRSEFWKITSRLKAFSLALK